MVEYGELYLGAMTGSAEVAEANLGSALVEYSESALLTQFAQGLERLNSFETQLKKQGKRINKLQSVVDSLEATCVRAPGDQTPQNA